MALVKTAALNPPVIERYLNYVGIRGKAIDAGAFGIENADIAIYFPSLDGNSYPGITYSDHPAAQFQSFKLHVFPKEVMKGYFMGALSKQRMGKISMPGDILKAIVSAVNESSGKANTQLIGSLSSGIAEAINTQLAQVHELAQYGISAMPPTAIKAAFSKSESTQPAVTSALYLNDEQALDDMIYKVAKIEIPRHILQESKNKIFEFLSQSFNNQSKLVIAQVIGRIIKVDPKFRGYLANHLNKATQGLRVKPQSGDEATATQNNQVQKFAADPELDMYFSKIPDEQIDEVCKSAVIGYLNELYRIGMKQGDLGLFGNKEDAASVEISAITKIVHAANNAAPYIDLDIVKLISTGEVNIAKEVVSKLRQSPDNQIENILASGVDFGANIESLKTLMYTMIAQVPEFSKMFANDQNTGTEPYRPAITKKGDKINIVSLTQSLPSQYNDWGKKIMQDLSNPNVINQLEMLK